MSLVPRSGWELVPSVTWALRNKSRAMNATVWRKREVFAAAFRVDSVDWLAVLLAEGGQGDELIWVLDDFDMAGAEEERTIRNGLRNFSRVREDKLAEIIPLARCAASPVVAQLRHLSYSGDVGENKEGEPRSMTAPLRNLTHEVDQTLHPRGG